MITNFKHKSIALMSAAAIWAAGAASAQTVIWGAGSGNATQSVGEFTSTNGTIAGAGWTELQTTHMWDYTTNGQSQGVNAQAIVSQGIGSWLTSPTVGTGAVIFDSDNYYSMDSTDFPQSGIIESPSIDLSAHAGGQLVVRFYASYLDFASDTNSVSFSPDGGATWNPVDVRTITAGAGVRRNFNGWVNVNISSFLTGPLTNCKLRFHFKGDSYFFAVDDVSIQTAPAYDIAIAIPGSGNTLGDAFTTAQVSNYYFQPLEQASGREYYYAARVTNYGTQDIINGNAQLHIKIDRETGANMWMNEYMDSIGIDTVAAGANVDVLDSIAWLPNTVGRYRAVYYVSHAGADASTSNDTITRIFNITNNDYFSKVPRNATDFYPAVTGASFPSAAAGNKVSEFEYGSMFFFPTGSRYILDSVTYRAYTQSVGAGFTGGTINVRVAEFVDVNGDGVLDNAQPNPELTLVGIGVDTLGVPAGTGGYLRGGAPMIDISGNQLMLQDNKVYLVSLAQSRATGLEDGTGSFFGYWYGSYDINYALNAGTDPGIAPSPVRVGEITSNGAPATNDWNWIGFGADQVPSIALNITLESAVVSTPSMGAVVNVYPNPTNEVLNVQVDLKAATNVQYIMTDASGRVVRMQTNKNVSSEIVTFDVANLPAGVYFMSIKTEKGVSTQRFVKQ